MVPLFISCEAPLLLRKHTFGFSWMRFCPLETKRAIRRSHSTKRRAIYEIWSEAVQQNCHHKCQSMTGLGNIQMENQPTNWSRASLAARGWRTPAQPTCCGYPRHTGHFCHITIPATFSILPLPLGCEPQCGSLAVSMRIITILSAHFTLVHLFESSLLFEVFIGLLLPQPLSHSPFNPCHHWIYGTLKLAENQKEEGDFDLLATPGQR